MITKAEAILSLNPKSEFVLTENELKWLSSDIKKPSDSEINAEVNRLQAEYEANKYQRDRADAYPSIQEQLDMQYWDAVNGTTKWKDAIAKVKTDNPKPSEQSPMANLVIKPTTNNSLKIQDQGGTERLSMNTSGEFSFTANTTFSADIETTTTGKVKQKGAFLQSSTHQALFLGY